MLKDNLRQYFQNNGEEKCGVVLRGGEVKELQNFHSSPKEAFAMRAEEILKPEIVATWHTHPTSGPNLTVADYRAFTAFPRFRHFIVAANDVWCFHVKNGILIRDEDPFTWVP